MSDLSERLAKLTPEQRARLASRLAGTEGRAGPPPAAPPSDLGSWDNYRCVPGTPGNFGALSFEEAARSAPGLGQIQIEARAVAINFRDLMIAMGMYPASPSVPTVMGSDYAGVVTACGEGVSEFRPGDRVMALSAVSLTAEGPALEGSHFFAVPNLVADQAVHIPDTLDFEAAAGVPTVFLTAYYALCRVARLQRGETVLVHSATGGLGQAALNIARWVGAEVFATAGSPEKRAFLESQGIEGPMDSRSYDFSAAVRRRTGGEGVDVILNTLSGEGVAKGLEALGLFGRFLHVDKQDIAQGNSLPLGAFNNALSFTVVDLALFFRRPGLLKDLFLEVADHMVQGHFAPVPTTSFPVSQVGDALSLMSRYEHMGKLVLLYE